MSVKRKLKIFGSTVSGVALGYIAGNVPVAIIGGNVGYNVADKVLDKNGDNKYIKKLF